MKPMIIMQFPGRKDAVRGIHKTGLLWVALLATGCDRVPTEGSAASRDGAPNQPATQPIERSPTPTAPASPANSGPALAVEGEGLRLFDRNTGSARPLPFGTDRTAVLGALAFRGPPGIGTNADCGADYANWPDGLGLHFQGGKFVGWTLDGRAADGLTTASGIGPGSTRAQLDAAYSARHVTSSLGQEFVAGGLAGLLDGPGPGAKVTNLWAGVSCAAR